MTKAEQPSYNCPKCNFYLNGGIVLYERARSIAAHALTVAADRFDEDARVSKEAGQARLAEQFERQARESRELAEEIEL